MSTRPNITLLRHIADVAKDIGQLCVSRSATPLPPLQVLSDHLLNDCVFPSPQPLTFDLVALGLDLKTAEQLSNPYIQATLRLQTECGAQYRRLARVYLHRNREANFNYAKAESFLQSVWISTYESSIRSWRHEVLAKFAPRVLRLKQAQSSRCPDPQAKHSRRPFNQSAVPLLERFFEHNAFPSRSEKDDLAMKTDMEYKQINVWFQNRRNRFKKDGKELKRGQTFQTLPPELGDAIAEILSEDFTVNADGDVQPAEGSCADEAPAVAHSTDSNVTFHLRAAPHAFPSPYPPACSYDPFPIQEGERHFSTPWLRTTNPTRKPDVDDIDIVLLSSQFMKMTVSEDTRNKGRRQYAVSKSSAQAYCASPIPFVSSIGFTTVIPRAPLSSLLRINAVAPVSSNTMVPDPHTFSRTSFPYLAATPTNTVASEPLIPATQAKKAISKRKVAGLPRRMPTSTSSSRSEIPLTKSSGSASTGSASTPSRKSSSTGVTSGSLASSSKVDPYMRIQPYYRPVPPSSRSRTSALGPTVPSASARTSAASQPPHLPVHDSMHSTSSTVVVASASKPNHHSSSGSLLQPTGPSRKMASYPKRMSNPHPSYRAPSSTHNVSPSPSSRSSSTLSRMSSVSSISSYQSASSSSEDDSPLHTPPLLPTYLSTPKLSLGPDPDYPFGESYLDSLSPVEGLQLDFLSIASADHITGSKDPALAFSGYPESSMFGCDF